LAPRHDQRYSYIGGSPKAGTVTGDTRDAGEMQVLGGAVVALDLLGNRLTASEERLLAVYQELKALCEQDLDPIAHANVRAALALMHQVVNGLALEYEHLTDLGV
jgi:Family of unknown function (DUF6052)